MEKVIMAILAKPTKRYIACVIDGLLFGILVLPAMIYTMQNTLLADQKYALVVLLFLYKVFVYMVIDFIIPLSNDGRTIGRRVMHIRLVKRNGKQAKPLNYVLRTSIFIIIAALSDLFDLSLIAYLIWVGVFAVSILLIYIHDYRMTVHDQLAQTIVIEDVDEFLAELEQ